MKKTNLFNSVMLVLIILSDISYILFKTINLKGMTSFFILVLALTNFLIGIKGTTQKQFSTCMFLGLVITFFSDVVVEFNVVLGDVLVCLSLLLFWISYVKINPLKLKDLLYSFVVFVVGVIFVLNVPIFNFTGLTMQAVYFVKLLLMSLVVGKAVSNYLNEHSEINLIVLLATMLLFVANFCSIFNNLLVVGELFSTFYLIMYYPALYLFNYTLYLTQDL